MAESPCIPLPHYTSPNYSSAGSHPHTAASHHRPSHHRRYFPYRTPPQGHKSLDSKPPLFHHIYLWYMHLQDNYQECLLALHILYTPYKPHRSLAKNSPSAPSPQRPWSTTTIFSQFLFFHEPYHSPSYIISQTFYFLDFLLTHVL
jgi:hypothetical protein